MKYIKTYESYYSDFDKVEKEIKNKHDEIFNLKQKQNNLEIECYNIIDDCFNNFNIYNEKEKAYEILLDYDSVNIKISKIMRLKDSPLIFVVYEKGIIKTSQFVDDLDRDVLGSTIDGLTKKFPDYFEGKSMGFFDLKTK